MIWIPVIIIAGCLWLKWEYNMAVKMKKKKHRTKCSRYRVERDGKIIKQAAE